MSFHYFMTQRLNDSITPTNPSVPQVRVFSMPEKYRHGAHTVTVEPQRAAPVSVAAPVVAPPPPASKPLTPQSISKAKPSHTTRALLVAGAIVLFALLIGGYLLLRSAQKTAPVQTKTATLPASSPAEQQTTPSSTTTPESTPQASSSPFPAAAIPGTDSDSDGLTNTEEELLYGSAANLPDTDADGFLDGNEVFHRYNPSALGTLLEAKLVQVLQGDGFTLLYPTKWVVLPADQGAQAIASTTGEKITIAHVLKPKEQSLADWYALSVKEGTPTPSKTKNGYPTLTAQDQLTVFIDLGTVVLTLTYDASLRSTIDYLQTFQMMVNSVSGL